MRTRGLSVIELLVLALEVQINMKHGFMED